MILFQDPFFFFLGGGLGFRTWKPLNINLKGVGFRACGSGFKGLGSEVIWLCFLVGINLKACGFSLGFRAQGSFKGSFKGSIGFLKGF